MRFEVKRSIPPVSSGEVVATLAADNWNDWFEFETLYYLRVFDATGTWHDIGGVKIGQFDWAEDQRRPNIPTGFQALDNHFFSLGQDVSYYAALANLGKLGRELLLALKDVVIAPDIFDGASNERVMGRSLMRSVSITSIKGQFSRVLNGGAQLTPFSFVYEGPKPQLESVDRVRLEFNVTPDSTPPTNINVLIGRNGVGKSYLLNGMTRALVSTNKDKDANGTLSTKDLFSDPQECPFANIVSVTFSAFDEFALFPESRNALKGIRYSHIGLRKRIKSKSDDPAIITQDPQNLAADFSESAQVCVLGERAGRWRNALTTLEADPMFAEAQVSSLAAVEEQQFTKQAAGLFRKLSSGHKIVLLTITRLVEKVEEKTLILMDEPEAHLHPPLLSAFIRAISDLLINRNGVAVIATHSPVVLQEVPASCVWKIVRHGGAARADRPEIETFGENVGVLTREVFGLEVTQSGFHKMLVDAIGQSDDIDTVLNKFDNEVGSEGRALVSSLIASQNNNGVG